MLDNTIRSRVPCRNLTTKHEHTYKLPHRLTKTPQLVQRSHSPYFHCYHPQPPIVIHTTFDTTHLIPFSILYNVERSAWHGIYTYTATYIIVKYNIFSYFVAGCKFSQRK